MPGKSRKNERARNRNKNGMRPIRGGEFPFPNTQSGNISAGRGPMASLGSYVEPFMPLFPARTTKRLRYASYSSLVVTTGAVATHVLRSSDCFDPDFTSTGHQPLGFDQMMIFYNHFIVSKARVICTFRNTSSLSVSIGLRVDADGVPITNPDHFREIGGCVLDTLGRQDTEGGVKCLILDIDILRYQGLNWSNFAANTSLYGTAAASPTDNVFTHIAAWDNNAGSSTIIVDFVLEQEVTFFEPRHAVPSSRVVDGSSQDNPVDYVTVPEEKTAVDKSTGTSSLNTRFAPKHLSGQPPRLPPYLSK